MSGRGSDASAGMRFTKDSFPGVKVGGFGGDKQGESKR